MTRVLYSWEMGGGLGHTQPLLQLARHRVLARHESIFAVPVPSASANYLDSLGLPFIHAPACVKAPPVGAPPAMQFRACSYADILAWHGFSDRTILSAQISAWRRLLDDVAPDLIIADFAPTLLLAARGRIPAIAIGNGFCTPPNHLPEFPALPTLADGREGKPLVPQAQIHDVIAQVLRDDTQASSTLTGWFRTQASIALVYPQLDPYAKQRLDTAAGPAAIAAGPLPPPVTPHVFAYLSTVYPALPPLLDALDRLDVSTSVCLRGDSAHEYLCGPNRRFSWVQTPFDQQAMLRKSSFFVHHGALGTAHALLDAGRPQLVLPHHLESTLTAQSLIRMGVAVGAGFGESHRLPMLLQQLLTAPRWTARAQAVAVELQGTNWPGADRVVAAAQPWLGNTK